MATVDIKANYGAVGDGQIATATLTTSGTGNKTLTSTTPLWAVNPTGKYIAVEGAGTYDVNLNPLATHLTTVASKNSDTQIVLTDTPPTPLTSAVKRVEWGTNDRPAFEAFNAANVGSNTTLTIPNGRYLFIASSGGATGFGFNIPNLTIVCGAGLAGSRGDVVLSAVLGIGAGFFLGGGAAQYNDADHAAMLETAFAGSTTIRLKNIGDAALFTENAYALVHGYNIQAEGVLYGYPSNPGFKEWVYVTDITGVVITLSAPLRYTYRDTWPNWDALGYGPATLFAVRPGWDCEHEYINLTVCDHYTVLNANARKITFRGGGADIGSFNVNISQTMEAIVDNYDASASFGSWEIDKLDETVTFRNDCDVRTLHFQSPVPDNFYGTDCHFDQFSGTPKNIDLRNCTVDLFAPGAAAYGGSKSVYAEGCEINEVFVGASNEDEIFEDWTYADGVFSKLKGSGFPLNPCWATPGLPAVYQSRHPYEGTFMVLDVTEEEVGEDTYLRVHTDLAGSFPAPCAPGTNFTFGSHPAPTVRFVNCTGTDNKAAAFSTASGSRPGFSWYSRTYVGNIGGADTGDQTRHVPVFGRVVSVIVTVHAGYSAGTFTMDPYCINKANNQQTTWIAVFNLAQPGTRTITPAGVVGTFAGDTGLALPSGANTWFVTGQNFPYMTGATGAGSVTVTIDVDQGFVMASEGMVVPLRLRLRAA